MEIRSVQPAPSITRDTRVPPISPIPPIAPLDTREALLAGAGGEQVFRTQDLTLTPLPKFNFTANVIAIPPTRTTSLATRRNASRSERTSGESVGEASYDGSAAGRGAADEEKLRRNPVQLALGWLAQGDSEGDLRALDQQLQEEDYDPLQRFNIYLAAAQAQELAELERQERRRMKASLRQLMKKVIDKAQLRRLLHDKEELEAAIAAVAGAAAVSQEALAAEIARSGRVRKRSDNVDVPLRARSLLQAMLRLVGSAGCLRALPALRSAVLDGTPLSTTVEP
ncbi:MAG TPA: hypothetical protein VIM12_13545 [Noviherbaspirillum sp.]|jgi:hypothetical protein|uniref:hypothetical protein n=1 Tax=Noviherbaspirillum sp. TaxID=1926288 RepID=UPI002F9436CF